MRNSSRLSHAFLDSDWADNRDDKASITAIVLEKGLIQAAVN